MRSEIERGGGAIRGLGKCVWLLLGSGDLVINGEYWIKSRLIAPMECQDSRDTFDGSQLSVDAVQI